MLVVCMYNCVVVVCVYCIPTFLTTVSVGVGVGVSDVCLCIYCIPTLSTTGGGGVGGGLGSSLTFSFFVFFGFSFFIFSITGAGVLAGVDMIF